MTKLLLLLLPLLVFSNENNIAIAHAELKPLGKMITTNAQITQLPNQKQKIVSRLSGHVEKYFVTPGQKVKTGDKVVLIESIALLKMSSEYVGMKQQTKAAKEQLSSTRKLYKKGLTSQNELNQKIIEIEEILANQNTLESQLKSLGIKASDLTNATDKFILYAHADGVVGEIFVPLHSNVNAEDILISLVNQSAYYAVAYLSVNDAVHITANTKGFLDIAGKHYEAHFVQLLPTIDEETQRAKVLFMMNEIPKNMLINAFVEMQISLEPYQDAVMVKKTALTLYKGEWVVFTENEHEEAGHHEEKSDHDHEKEDASHDEHDHDAHAQESKQDTHGHEAHDHDAHSKEKEHTDHDIKAHTEKEEAHGEGEHEVHEEEEAPYEANVVEVIAYVGDYVAIKGLKVEQEYVSDGVYFVKSLLLKSSLGEHGH